VGTAADGDRVDEAFRRLIFRTLGIDVPSPRDLVIVRLLLLSWHGILHLAISGRLSPSEAESDLRVACELLVPGSSALQTAATQTAAIRTRARPGPSR
jgi:hypothetical protein